MTDLSQAITPGEAVAKFAKIGAKVSERSLREKARRLGCYRQIGQAMFFLPADLETLMEPEPCSSPSKDRKARTMSRGERSTGGRSKEAPAARSYQMPAKNAQGSKPRSEAVEPITFHKAP